MGEKPNKFSVIYIINKLGYYRLFSGIMSHFLKLAFFLVMFNVLNVLFTNAYSCKSPNGVDVDW